MTAIYVKEQGAMVRRRGERLAITKQGKLIDEIPLAQVEQLALMGNVQLTTQATATLLQREIDVVFMSIHGKFRGRLVGPGESKNVQLRRAQLKMMEDENKTFALAKATVDGKIHNQRVVLQRQAKRLAEQGVARGSTLQVPNRPDFDRALEGMMRMKRDAAQAKTADQLRGYEGKSASFYFSALRTFLHPMWGFKRREFYPAPDPFNALLSFSYSLVLKDVRAAVKIVGLDLYLGYFHEVSHGRPSLALDLMEEWRPVIADSLTLELINRGTIHPQDFERTNNPKRPIQLAESGLQQVLHAYGSRLQSKFFHPLAGQQGGQTTLHRGMELQARLLGRVVSGNTSQYEPMKIK